ncbi:MAG TPA: amino acid adenylation domain-containing protein, partial [Thermoanaerobaculia bacterium]|nr:amino acid adenylation domain-containing protein [Thermoanaerobaculia bacterium]
PVRLSGELGQEVRALSRREGATPFMVLLAAFQALLSRYSGQVDLAVGTPIAGRNRLETEGLIGFFVNTLALRGDVSGEPSFRALLARTRETSLAAHTHQDVPFERLVDELAPERNLSHTPLFQVVLVLQNVPAAAPGFAGLTLAPLPVQTGTAKFDLTLTLAERESGLEGQVEYATDLFDGATVDRLLEHWVRLLEAALAAPEARIGELPLLIVAERAALLAAWAPAAGYPEERTLPELFREQVARRGEAEALSFEDGRLIYRELGRRVRSLAHRLRRLEVGPEVRVGLCAERSVDLVVGLLGILEAGGVYVPLDPSYPADRLAFLMEDSAIGVVAGQEAVRERLPAGPWAWVPLAQEATPEDSEAPLPPPLPDSAAYVIYTSGSTGRPKGVVVTHRNVTRLLRSTEAVFGFGPGDVWTLFHSFAFDFSVWELWGALAYGGRLVVVPYWLSRTPKAFLELLEREGVTVLNQTPSAFRQLTRIEQERPLALRVVIFGGEALEPSSLLGFHRRYPGVRLVNMYGITETTVHVTFRELSDRDLEGASSVIGRAISDLGLYVLDRHREPVPVGVGGELHVGGAGLARGYLGRPELTAERFVPDPFASSRGEAGARLYRSGDLGRYVASGDLEYLGRIDEQVKIRGFRIELGEIETALSSHPGVREAVVVARPPASGGGGDRRLVGYAVGRPGGALDLGALRAYLRERLPEHMVPVLIELPALPLTINGKVDRKALPEPETQRVQVEQRPPQTWTEEVLAGIWSRVLGLGEIGTGESFFALGGDSILSLQVVALARERGLSLELQDLFQHQTLRDLAQAVDRNGAAGAADLVRTGPFSLVSPADRTLLPDDLEDAYPLSQLQGGMLYHMQLAAEEAPYHNVDTWLLRARFDAPLFEQAVARVVARHAVLRTSFEQTRYSESLQLVHREARLPVMVEDLRGLPVPEQQERIATLFASEKERRFDLGRAPQLRFAVQVLSGDSFQFTLTENHAIFDGWSLHTALSEIFSGYFALQAGRELPEEPPPAVTFRDFIALERQALASEEHLRFWDQQMRGWTFTELPPADPGAPEQSLSRKLEVAVPAEVWTGLQGLARELAVPVKSVLLATHLKAIGRVSGSDDVLIGLTSNGRPETSDGEKVCGLFLNLVPFRLVLEPGTWHDLVREVFARERAILPFRRFPMPALQRRLGGQKLFEIAFNYIHFHVVDALVRSGDMQVLGFKGSETTNFAWQAHFTQIPTTASLALMFEHDLQRVSHRQAAAIAEVYLRILTAMAADGAGRNDGPLLSEAERQQTVVEWNDSATGGEPLPLVHELIARHSRHTPEALAVAHGDETLSYGELDVRARRLARRLAELGVGPEVRVGLLLERSIELVVGLLSILEAGGAFVPLDPAYPRERLAFSLRDSGASLLLTRRALLESLPGVEGVTPLYLDEPTKEITEPAYPAPGPGVGQDNLAYVLYTSGSTGRPKGVMVPHRGLSHYLDWCLQAYPVAEGWGAPVHSSIAFDLTITSLFAPLTAGRSIRLLDESLAAEALADALSEASQGERYSLVKLTPGHMTLLADRLQGGDAAGALGLVIGGE